MNINEITKLGGQTFGRALLYARKYAPTAAVYSGVVGLAGAGVMAAVSSRNLDETLDRMSERVNAVKRQKTTLDQEGKYAYSKKLISAWGENAREMIVLYGPPISVAAVSVGLILGGHHATLKRSAAVVAAYNALNETYNKYRDRVVETLGEDKEREMREGAYSEEVEEVVDGKKTKKTVKNFNPHGRSPYAKFFDECSREWQKVPELNLFFLRCQQNWANDLLVARGHVFLNEVYDMLDIPRTKAGAIVGWINNGDGDNFIDFGLYDNDDPKVREFVNGYERSIFLDFNVDGVIYDKI